jgi:hypothetical protein
MDESLTERRSILSARSVEILLDLVEIRLGAMEIEDRDDRIIGSLRRCRAELKRIEDAARTTAAKRGPGRPRRVYEAA